MQIGVAAMEDSMKVPLKLNSHHVIQHTHPEQWEKNMPQKGICSSMRSLQHRYNSRDVEAT